MPLRGETEGCSTCGLGCSQALVSVTACDPSLLLPMSTKRPRGFRDPHIVKCRCEGCGRGSCGGQAPVVAAESEGESAA